MKVRHELKRIYLRREILDIIRHTHFYTFLNFLP